MRLSVRIEAHGFSGQYDRVWIGADEFDRFLAALRELEATRGGVAAMEALSPEEFWLAVGAADGSSSLIVEGQLGRWVFARYWHSVTFGFEFCPSLLGQAVGEFVGLGRVAEQR
jgi:hypothetical protein